MQLDLIVRNARIVTMDDSRPEAHSMGIWRGLITGFDEELDGMTATETFDAGGECVLPGFIDGHTHCAVTGFRYGALDISTCNDIAAVLNTIGRAAADVEPGEWGLTCSVMTNVPLGVTSPRSRSMRSPTVDVSGSGTTRATPRSCRPMS